MTRFYAWPGAALLVLTFVVALTVLSQTLAMVRSFQRHHKHRGQSLEDILELSVLLQILACSLLHGQVMQNYSSSLIAPTMYGAFHIFCFVAVTLMAILVFAMTRKTQVLLIIAVSGLMLPIMEAFFEKTFAYIYLAVMLFYLIRSICICILLYRECRISLSFLSIKNTIDSLHTGVLFSEQDGFILLSNVQMQKLMSVITGGISYNGNHFYELLTEGNVEPGCQRSEFEGQIVCLLPDETAWMFTRTELQIKRKGYIQITATDITKRWTLTAQLLRQESELKIKGEKLSQTIDRLHILSWERETQKAKMRAHDILGQRLTLLLRTIHSEQALDYDLLRSFSQELLDDLKANKSVSPPQDELDTLQQVFGSIGVDIKLDGKLPKNRTKERMFVDIIREGVTNAVRHGFATKIFVQIVHSVSGYRLKIANNGHPPSQPVVEGGGIGGMRKMVEQNGGTLDVTAHPHFVLTAYLPGGEADV